MDDNILTVFNKKLKKPARLMLFFITKHIKQKILLTDLLRKNVE